ncbi:sigma-w pathway protein ysdB [Oceanobacillus halotolerans]|uniref:sigma-w pathway protein ysdB n=1 Tax=Oceanobacillus halotolerans TaxID=2663380 RepID=UPI0013DA4B3D|nr:sigma-w pathway protein ysdB [Oceanobacillus halotolerans]
MIIVVFRILLLIAFVVLVYSLITYYRNPERQIRLAKQYKTFYFHDDPANNQKNFQIVYKGCLFEGEKYLGTTEQSFEVVTIHIFVHEPLELKGITKDDLYFLEKEILIRYPHAAIEWRHPINQLVSPNK